MKDFTAHRVRFGVEVTRPLGLPEFPGSALRGALFRALIDQFCANPAALERGGCQVCPLLSSCPVAYLAATLDPEADRGENVPRPFTIEPPVWRVDDGRPTTDDGQPTTDDRRPTTDDRRPIAGEGQWVGGGRPPTGGYGQREAEGGTVLLERGERFEFGVTMFAQALQLFPYVVLAAQRMGEVGLGQRTAANGWRRGQFAVREIWADNPVTGERQTVLQRGSNLVAMPEAPITHSQLAALPAPPAGALVEVRFLTPLRLKHQRQVVHEAPPFRALFQRLMERVSSLAQMFSATPLDPDLRYALVGLSDRVRLVTAQTRWVPLEAYSGRQRGHTSISGFVGHVVYEAEDWSTLWPWLKWAEIIHVGKNAVKGEGMVRVAEVAVGRGESRVGRPYAVGD